MVEYTKEFEFLAESLPQLVWMKNPDGSRSYLSKKWSEYTGIPLENKTWDWTQAIHPEALEKTIFCWNECVTTGNLFQCECRIRKKDGTYRWYLVNAVHKVDSSGNIVWVRTCTDTHDYRIREEQLSEKNKELQKITSELGQLYLYFFFQP
jgi:PAS domain S-box-containing protein